MTFQALNHSRIAGAESFDDLLKEGPRRIFDPMVVEMLSAFSKILMKDEAHAYPDVVSLGFFCRRANLSIVARRYTLNDAIRIGRGHSVHYTPSNVPLNFCYSMIAALLAGNSCVVRLSNKASVVTEFVVEKLNAILSRSEFEALRNRIFLFRSQADDKLNQALGDIADIRIIWGGDQTVRDIRKASLKPHAYDITFPDRYSICLIAAKEYLEENDKRGIATAFYNDTFVFDQNACSSPKAILWIGDQVSVSRAQELFWNQLDQQMRRKGYKCPASKTNEKLTKIAGLAVSGLEPRVSRSNMTGNVIVNTMPEALENADNFTGGGYFLQVQFEHLAALPVINDHRLQTVTHFGFAQTELEALVLSVPTKLSAERLVKIGNATAFDVIWDGYDLIGQMSKFVLVQ